MKPKFQGLTRAETKLLKKGKVPKSKFTQPSQKARGRKRSS